MKDSEAEGIVVGAFVKIQRYELGEEQCQTILLALAKLELERPGWNYHIATIADVLKGREMLEKFKRIHAVTLRSP